MTGERKLTRKEQAENTKLRLEQAGLELISSRDFDDIKIEDVTDACGVSKGTFYLYYKSKNDFFAALCLHNYDKVVACLTDPDEPSAMSRLENFIRGWMDLQDKTSIYYARHWFKLLASGKTSSDGEMPDVGEQYKEPLRECVRQAIAQGELSEDAPVDGIAEMILVAVYGSCLRDVMTNRERNPAKWGASLAPLIIGGCCRMWLVEPEA